MTRQETRMKRAQIVRERKFEKKRLRDRERTRAKI